MRRISLYFSRRHQRASTRVRKRSSAQDAAKFNSVELSRFTPRTPAIQPIMYRCHEFSLQRIELAITSVSSLVTNQFVASDSQRARNHSQSSVVTPRVNMSFSFISRFSRHLIDLPVRIAVLLLVIFCLAVFRLFTDLITNSIRLQTQPVTSA